MIPSVVTDPTLDTHERDFWNGPAGDWWVRCQQDLDTRIAVFGRAALDALDPRVGERVLDVGCGCGDTTLDLSERVGAAGRVTGLDVSAPMLARARERAAGRVNVDFVLGDAATWSASAPYDALTSRFGVMFFSDPIAAFANLRNALAPHGRLTFVCWRSSTYNPWALYLAQVCWRPILRNPAFKALDAEPVVGARSRNKRSNAPGPFSFARPEEVHRILRGAGFVEIVLTPFAAPLVLGENVEAAVQFASEMGPCARLLRELAPDQSAVIREAIHRAMARVGPRVVYDGAVWIVSGRRA